MQDHKNHGQKSLDMPKMPVVQIQTLGFHNAFLLGWRNPSEQNGDEPSKQREGRRVQGVAGDLS